MQAVNVAEEEPIKVELVDDHSVFRHGMRELLEEDPGLRVVAEADTADSAVEKAIEYHPDVVLMDINLPLKNGIQATREIKAELPGTVVLVLNGVSPAQADRALDPIVPEAGGVAGVVYCTLTTLEPLLQQRGWPRVAGVDSRALAAPLTQNGVLVLPPDRALRALGELGMASAGGVRIQASCMPQDA